MVLPYEWGSILHLLLMVLFSLLYVRFRSIVVLPAVMVSSLIGVMTGLEVHPFIRGMKDFAVPLLVFIAGLKVKPRFIEEEKERVTLMWFVEAALFLTFFYLSSALLPLELALTLSSLIVASNEMFAIQASRIKGKDIGLYGITLSVFEDILAVFLLSLGFFTLSAQPAGEELGLKIASTLSLIPVLYLLSSPFDRLIDRIGNIDSKILLTVLYLAMLVGISEIPGIPEALIVFIGAIMLSIRGFDEKVFEVFEGYLSLALIGFVATLPYLASPTQTGIWLNLVDIAAIAAAGLALSIAAFILRSIFVFLASILTGLTLEKSLTLSIALGNTGEFGLIVVSYLISSSNLIPPRYAYIAMFAYTFNLTIVSFITNREAEISGWIRGRLTRITTFLNLLSEGGGRFVDFLASDVRLKKNLLELAVLVSIGYSSTTLYGLVEAEIINYILAVIIVSSYMTALQKLFQEFSWELERSGKLTGIFKGFIKALLLYVVAAPLIGFLGKTGGSGGLLQLASPVNLILIIAVAYSLSKLTSILVGRIMSSGKAGGGSGVEG